MLTGYWIDRGHICGTDGDSTGYWIDDGRIYGPDGSDTGWRVKGGHIHGRDGLARCWIDENLIHVILRIEKMPWSGQ